MVHAGGGGSSDVWVSHHPHTRGVAFSSRPEKASLVCPVRGHVASPQDRIERLPTLGDDRRGETTVHRELRGKGGHRAATREYSQEPRKENDSQTHAEFLLGKIWREPSQVVDVGRHVPRRAVRSHLQPSSRDHQSTHLQRRDIGSGELDPRRRVRGERKDQPVRGLFHDLSRQTETILLPETLGQQVLYFDMDSVIYNHVPGEEELENGDYLGDLTDELDAGQHIVDFTSGGPKNYGYRTSSSKTECKVRGFSLHNVRGSSQLNYEVLRRNVLEEVTDPRGERRVIDVTNPHFFTRDAATKRLRILPRTKQYGLVFDRRVVDPETFISYPYGYF